MNSPASRSRTVTDLAIQRPVATFSLAALVVVIGLFFVERLSIDLLPTIEYPQIRVTVNYPGTTPEVMEQQVTRVLERNLAATENLVHLDSRASEGRTNVNLHFEFGTNLDLALQDAARYLELARTQLPDDIEPPRLYKFDPSQDPVWQAGFSSTARDTLAVSDWVETQLAPQLIALPGVAAVETAGGQIRELTVTLDQQRLDHHGLTLADVHQAIADSNVDVAGGWLTSDRFDVMVRTEAPLDGAQALSQVRVPLPDQARISLPLDALAEITDGPRRQRLFVRQDGVPAAQISLFKLPGANTVDVVSAVQQRLANLERSGFIPADIHVQPLGDQAFFIRAALASVTTAALVGGILAMLLVVLFLGSLRNSLTVSVAVPMALLASFALMGASGVSLNIISLGGLALGIGLLLDNGIVMLENITRRRVEDGLSAEQAAHEGAHQVRSAIIAGTVTNLAAVLPFLLISGLASLIFTDLILTLSFAILATLLVALTVVPALAAQLGRVRQHSGLHHSPFIRRIDRCMHGLKQAYQRALGMALRQRWWVLLVALSALLLAMAGSQRLGNEFLPQVDDGNIRVRLVLPPGTPPEKTLDAATQIEYALQQLPHVETVFAMVGGHLGGGIINERPGTANLRVQLTALSTRPEMGAAAWVQHAQQSLAQLELPGARISVRPPSIPGLRFSRAGEDLAITVTGHDLRELRQLGMDIVQRLQDIPGLDGVEMGRESQSPLLQVKVDRQRAADLGIPVQTIAEAIRQGVEGHVVDRVMMGNQDVDIRVRLPAEAVTDADQLGNLLLMRHNDHAVRLADVTQMTLIEGPAHIERENQSRVVRVVGDMNTAVADVGSVMASIEQRLAGLTLPDNVSLVFGGQWETIQETQRELRQVILLALFLVFVVLAVQYEKLTNPLVILVAAPLSLTGVVAALALTGSPLSAPVMIGVVLLIGIVVNNAILLVEYIEQQRQQGRDVRDAILQAGQQRLRPILMTTLTTVLGMLPLAIGWGEGAEIMRPLAITVSGGLLSAMVLTLFVVPCLYLVIDGLKHRLHRRLFQ